MAVGLEPGPANPQPFSAGMPLAPSFDVIEVLPERAADRLRALRQHVADRHAVIPPFADIHDANTARGTAERQLQRLLAHRAEGGFHLDPTDKRVIVAQELLAKLTADAQRLKELDEVRSAAWRSASATLVNAEQFLRMGLPPGTVLHDFDGPEVKLSKREVNLIDVIENRRRRVRELKADAHRIRSAPFPSNYAKSRMREQITALAQQGAPDLSDLIENDRRIVFQSMRLQSSIVGAETAALGFAELDAAIPFAIWLHAETVIKKLDAEIDSESDDKSALSHEARQKAEAEVMGDLLDIERQEAELTWRAQAERLPVEHRADINPVALLGVRLVTAPAVNPSPGTSPQHVITFGGRR